MQGRPSGEKCPPPATDTQGPSKHKAWPPFRRRANSGLTPFRVGGASRRPPLQCLPGKRLTEGQEGTCLKLPASQWQDPDGSNRSVHAQSRTYPCHRSRPPQSPGVTANTRSAQPHPWEHCGPWQAGSSPQAQSL